MLRVRKVAVGRPRWLGLLLVLGWFGARDGRGQLAGRPPADTAAMMRLYRRGDSLSRQQPAAALAIFRRACVLADQAQYRPGYFRSMQQQLFILNKVGCPAEARSLGLRALARARQDTSK